MMRRTFLLPSLSAQELLELQRLLRASSTPAGIYRRCLLVWHLAAGASLVEASRIARLHYTNAHKWMKRFRSDGLCGLRDKPRAGRPRLYGKQVESLIIETATSQPRALGLGFTTWSLPKLAQYLREFPQTRSIGQETIRRILTRYGLRFLTGRTWCHSNDPDFEVKKNAIISLYRNPPKRGHTICFDEMGPLQTIPRGGKSLGTRAARRPDRYRRNGTLQWLCAFSPHTGKAVGKGYPSKPTATIQEFWLEQMFPAWSQGRLHLVMDNLSVHKKALRELPAQYRRRLKVYWTPTNSSWLNLLESYFATLQQTALNNTDFKTPEEIEQSLLRGVQYLNDNPRPYRWKKT